MTSDLLAPLDLAFWNIESDRHPMHLGALGIFAADSPGAARHAAELLATRSVAVPGLRMRIRDAWPPFGGAVRAEDAHFDPARHVHLACVARDFHAAAGELMERPLNRARPPWEVHVLPDEDGTSFAVLFKFHHALADGLRALTLAAGVMDPLPEAAPRRPKPAPAPATGPGPRVPDLAGTLDLLRRRVGEVGQALDIGASVALATLGFLDTAPALTADATGTRRTAGVVVDIDDIHRIRKGTGGTVNDVLIAAVAGALRRWLTGRGESGDGVRPRALIPVSRRRPRDAHPGGNRLSGYLIRLPVAEPDPLERLRLVRTAMDRNKEAGPNRGAGAVALLADHVPPVGHRLGGPVVAQAARLLFDILVTSVPLPGIGLRLGGCPLTAVYPFAPLAQGQSLAVAVSTYRGNVHYGLIADAEAVPDLDHLAEALRAEIAELGEAADGAR
ncbi:wax ester/triacylglycerol synthase family O-acyltransferase [Streptomyces sp. LHD-70]|uniref:wax ester/triacylglycerol synthase family O-acyltransferase n=1 Tax=Streptomyces sp. LHD-70 TaxID=3072140 RepID=UPI00280D5CD8|nr:wax ester/triacylglycerol synthase family O-acyltransferase [Streptomyces sp. LHD-70]MDQ8705032.1 wax ester/triacylglycerol synthase family O-acyltransferase [Streptomyces sp. LHD-70]